MKNRILIVDDDELNRDILTKIVGDEYESAVATSGEECLEMMASFGPDLVLLDIMMPGMDGYEVCRRIKSAPHGELTHVILVSGKGSTKERLIGFEAGADDYLVKPFDHEELYAKIQIQFRLRVTLIALARANQKIEAYNTELEDMVSRRTEEVLQTRNITVFALAKLAESRDPETGQHLERLRTYSQILAEELSRSGPYTDQIDDQFLTDLFLSSPLHDIGKVGIPDAILLKPDRLSTSEFEIMKRHTFIGSDALREASGHTNSGDFLDMAASIAWSHHERFNGSGYPDGLRGHDIPLAARIVALADVYDALTSVRVYKDAFTPNIAKSMIDQEAEKHFDPAIVTAFDNVHDKFLGVTHQDMKHAQRHELSCAVTGRS